jgi:steroid delta-isomerase-like uncharacterized protein
MKNTQAEAHFRAEDVVERMTQTAQSVPHHVLVDRYLDEILNRGDFNKADEILAPGFLFHGPTTPEGLNRTGFRLFLKEIRAAFSDKHFKELERITEGHRTALRFRMTGTQDGYLKGIPPLGVAIDVECCDLISVHNGRILEVRAYFDVARVIREFLIPPPLRFVQQLLKGSRLPRG